MADIVNLRQKRKEAARKAARAEGDQNAVKFGQTRADRALHKAQADKARADLEAHKRDPDR